MVEPAPQWNTDERYLRRGGGTAKRPIFGRKSKHGKEETSEGGVDALLKMSEIERSLASSNGVVGDQSKKRNLRLQVRLWKLLAMVTMSEIPWLEDTPIG